MEWFIVLLFLCFLRSEAFRVDISTINNGFLHPEVQKTAFMASERLSEIPRTDGGDVEHLRAAAVAKRRVVITGLGVVNGVGVGIDEFFENLLNGTKVMSTLEGTPDDYRCQVVCKVRPEQFNPRDWYKNPKEVNRNDRYAQFAMAASKMAVQDGKLNVSALDADKFGVLIGSGIGGISWIEREYTQFQKSPNYVSPYLVPAMISNVSPGAIGIELNARGPNFSVVTACATGSHAIGEAFRIIQRGEADVMLAGGSEATVTDFVLNGFNRIGATAKGWNNNPKSASRPFDAKRSGFVMGEGAGVVLLETVEHALRRGAHIYGELAGYGSSCDAHHVTAPRPDGSGLQKAAELAILESGIPRTSIGYINAHGTSTPLNDKTESLAIRKIFGEHADKLLVSSTKSMTGHCLGAAGGIEATVAAKVLETGIAPPTINYEVPDPACDLFYCPNTKVVKEGGFEAVMSFSLGFGGQNAVLLMTRYPARQTKN